tara:strand:- start:9299 stop:10315 length:1017 start_codon:yes stop_codon:yes gene_type:complete
MLILKKIKLSTIMKFRCKKLLVTGGAGFIGSNFISYLLEKYDDLVVYNLDLLTYAGDLTNTNGFCSNNRYKFIQGDICDIKLLDSIFKKYNIDGVINFAAESHVDNSIENPKIFIETNIMGVYSLLETCYKNWMSSNFKYKSNFEFSRFHQISTDEVYGSINNGSFNEEDVCKPNSPYSASKASADMIVRSYSKTYGLDTVITRCSNNFGPNQNKEKFIPMIIDSIRNQKAVNVYGKGDNIRDWICVSDHCRAIDIVYNKGKKGSIYNIAGKNEITNLELIDLIYFLMDSNNKKLLNFVNDRFGHDKRYSVDISKISKELSWEPSKNMNDSLKKILVK